MTSLFRLSYYYFKGVHVAEGGAKMLSQKSCPRCKKGNIGVDKDQYGWYEYCIQCGYVRDLISLDELGQEAACGEKKAGGKAEPSEEGEQGPGD
jgi:hypothetical protein